MRYQESYFVALLVRTIMFQSQRFEGSVETTEDSIVEVSIVDTMEFIRGPIGTQSP